MNRRALALALFVFGCGTDVPLGPPTVPGLKVPPKPTNGVQVITPIFDDIQPSADYEVCTWTDTFFDQDTNIDSIQAWQNEPPGHHVMVFYTMSHRPPGTQKICDDADMVSFRFVAGSGMGILTQPPGNLVYHVPAGAQLVVNHHYLNATDGVLRGQAIANVGYAKPGNYINSGNVAVIDPAIQVKPGSSSWDIHCPVDHTIKAWEMFPHMHQYGAHARLGVTQGGVTNELFDVDWDPSFTFHPPMKTFDPATPLTLHAGDAIDMHCDWNNTTSDTLAFGKEMCVAFAFTVDDGNLGNLACDAGQWGPF
jgi:hypothetical protein